MGQELHQIGGGSTIGGDEEAVVESAPAPAAAGGGVAEPVHEEPVAPGTAGMINIRNLSVKCGYCDTYQTLMTFSQTADGWNVYTYECENGTCDAERSRTHLEIPHDLDEYAHRDPGWRGGAIHGGAE